MFMGEYKKSIDDKGRLILPSKLREELGERVVICRGFDSCLYVYDKDEWDEYVKKIKDLPLSDSRTRKMRQYIMSGGVFCDLDKQGRIVIPSYLREELGDSKDLALIGDVNHIEIWSEAVWNEHISEIKNDLESVTADLTELGITF